MEGKGEDKKEKSFKGHQKFYLPFFQKHKR